MKFRTTAVILASLSLSAVCLAQESAEYRQFADSSGYLATIYRGPEARKYNFAYNGTPFWFSPDFQNGDLRYNGKTYHDITMNVDAYDGDLLLRPAGGITSVVAVKEFVEWFTLNGRMFVNLKSDPSGLADGYYWKVCSTGDVVFYCRVEKTRDTDISVNSDMIGYKDPNIRSYIHEYFKFNQNCYLVKGNEKAIPIRNKGALLKQFKQRKNELKKNVYAAPADTFGANLTNYAAAVFKYLNDNE